MKKIKSENFGIIIKSKNDYYLSKTKKWKIARKKFTVYQIPGFDEATYTDDKRI